MAFQIVRTQVDLNADRARIELTDPDTAAHLVIHVQTSTLGDQPVNQLEQAARAAAKQALQDAVPVLSVEGVKGSAV